MDAVKKAILGDHPESSAGTDTNKDQQTRGQESPIDKDLQGVESVTGLGKGKNKEDLDPEAQKELAQLRTTLQNNIQSSRMQHHAFEALSLPGSQPASRVPSGSNTPQRRPHMHAGSTDASPKPSPPNSTVHSPPLTPAATKTRDRNITDGLRGPANATAMRPPQDIMTPQRSASPISSVPKQQPSHSVGPCGDSQPPSKDASRSGTPASTVPGTPRPLTPSGDSKTTRSSEAPDLKYRFGSRDPAAGYANSGSGPTLPANMPGVPRTGSVNASKADPEKRSSFFGGGKKEHSESSAMISEKGHQHSSSKSNLKRFFKFGDHKHKHNKEEGSNANGSSKDGTKTPTRVDTKSNETPAVPFADDNGLQSKYGKFGKMLGSGAGGSVRLMKRSGDGTVFAVKQFRDRHAYESERDYNKKVTAEFCIGSTLHHGNIIETIDIVYEKGKWYEVMEYAPYDLFATVMTGKMGREEVTCATLQILSGVLYLHSMGLAHRDLKLDNVVINEHGIMKLIDFGSAVVFRYPFENDVVLATGVVGSDPYLAPEVYDQSRYDPRPADVWSIAIIFCCMTLRRFPWKAPRLSDNSYRLFVSPPDPGQEQLLDSHRRSIAPTKAAASTPASRNTSNTGEESSANDAASEHKHHHHHHHTKKEEPSHSETVNRQTTGGNSDAQATIKGPVRLLRLLPRETRHIIGRMLELDPRKRADMDQILKDPWVQNSLVCRQEENGVIIRAPNHTHTLQPSNAGGN